MTEQLYYTHPELDEFTATVIGVEFARGRTIVELDRTAFYPEGGGQPCDLGTLGGQTVTHVGKEDGRILHVLEPDSQTTAEGGALTVGTAISGRIDAARRHDYMQQHTGQHIISAALLRTGGFNTVSVHLGDEYATIEIDARSISETDLEAAEDSANKTIEQALPVITKLVTDAEVGSYPLRRPPKVSGTIRLVMVGDADCAACGGVHVDNSARVRLVHAIATENIRNRVRLSWKIGDRALADYRVTSSVARDLGSFLSAQLREVPRRVRKQEERVRTAERELKRSRTRVREAAARNLLANATRAGSRMVVTARFTGEEKDFLRGVAEALIAAASEAQSVAACLANVTGDRLQWSIAMSPDTDLDYSTVRDAVLPLIDGKGGGRPPVWQGVGSAPDRTTEFLEAFRRIAGA